MSHARRSSVSRSRREGSSFGAERGAASPEGGSTDWGRHSAPRQRSNRRPGRAARAR
jgi:hypothetical protein